jgi:hypothetical protein
MSQHLIDLAEEKGAIYPINYATFSYLLDVQNLTHQSLSLALGRSHSYMNSYIKSRLIDGKLYLTRFLLNSIADYINVDKRLLQAENASFYRTLKCSYVDTTGSLVESSLDLGEFHG